jgi:V8-like Glu-specific endopeptidase
MLVAGKSAARLKSVFVRVGDETVIGADERMLVGETERLPWRMIASLGLRPRPPLGSSFIGTGWFIGPRTLLTAGHCVYSASDFGGWIGSIEVAPGRKGEHRPYGKVVAKRFSALDAWRESGDADFDIGCIHLDEPLGERTGYFKIASLTDGQLQGALLNISGYPGDRDGGVNQYFHANRVLHSSARRVYYDIDTYGGQSGSPVWHQESADAPPVAVGVHAYGVGGTSSNLDIVANSGPRLIPEVVEVIREWLATDSA